MKEITEKQTLLAEAVARYRQNYTGGSKVEEKIMGSDFDSWYFYFKWDVDDKYDVGVYVYKNCCHISASGPNEFRKNIAMERVVIRCAICPDEFNKVMRFIDTIMFELTNEMV